MMKIYKVLRVAAAASLLSGFIASGGCTRDEVLPLEEATAPAQSGCVSIEHALEALSRFNDGEALTRTAEVPAVAHVDVLMRSDVEPATRTADAGEDAPLCYIAQFEGGGYAILGANDKQAPVVAYVPKGSLTAQELADAKAAADRGEDHETPTYINACVVEYLQDAAEGLVESTTSNENTTDLITYSNLFAIRPIEPTYLQVEWSQWHPYNNACELNSNGTGRKPVGCVALALGQVLAFNKNTFNVGPSKILPYGSYLPSEIYYPNWSTITNALNTTTPSPTCQYDLGLYLYKIGKAINTTYGDSISFAYTHDMIEFLTTQVGYKNVSLRSANMNDIRTMLNNCTPIIGCGTAQITDSQYHIEFGGNHCWVIDGWQQKQEIFTAPNTPEGYITFYYDYLYCHYGYAGKYDGWYLFESGNLKNSSHKVYEIIYYTL